VEVTASGWRMMSSEAVPVKFIRKNNAASLPHPVTGVTIELLRRLLNVRTDEDFRLLVAWLIGALNPDGPYPVLALQGIEARRLEVILLAVGGLATVALSRAVYA
jgi:putative DNA primase/helicase